MDESSVRRQRLDCQRNGIEQTTDTPVTAQNQEMKTLYLSIITKNQILTRPVFVKGAATPVESLPQSSDFIGMERQKIVANYFGRSIVHALGGLTFFGNRSGFKGLPAFCEWLKKDCEFFRGDRITQQVNIEQIR